ncbi:MAG: enoyl-CoA hydratase/isomerase family protein, partial [Parvibaculum sp.]|uniref:enoyl-CoA hydratase-related protein n=1 Tax=Parvibaculum sp. TaxID=2024848 RepID=UPI0025E57A4C
MEFERVKLDIDGHVGTLTLNHPEVMNAVSPQMLSGLMLAMDQVEDPKNGIRCLVMTGEGRGFCTGANL